MRRRRHDVTVELRKARKEDQMQKRRNISSLDEPISPLQELNLSHPHSFNVEQIIAGKSNNNYSQQNEMEIFLVRLFLVKFDKFSRIFSL